MLNPDRKTHLIMLLFIIILSACTGNNNNYNHENQVATINEKEAVTEEEVDSNSGNADTRHETRLQLEDVTHWFYILDVNLDEAMIQTIEDSRYDLIVIDFIPSEENNTDFPIADVVERWQTAEHPKLVIAYIDIGQAESFRAYWQKDWEIGNPGWILGEDPDGWVENYPVAYWYDEYQEIWLGEDGTMNALLDAGFDGIYLDWIEAYDDEMVIAMAEDEGLDPIQEMIWWIGDLADFGRAQNPDFIVIAQNAADLAIIDSYAEIIDAIAQEQTWFDGGADNLPPGDCPLPETESDIDTAAYESSLSELCLNQYLEFPNSTLHVSSAWYLKQLLRAQRKGLTIFTVDYAIEEENIEWLYETSRAYGFIPFVSNRWLDQFVDLMP